MAEYHIWLVDEGRQLFIDRNTNGDLTDDGPPLARSQPFGFHSNRKPRMSSAEKLVEFSLAGR